MSKYIIVSDSTQCGYEGFIADALEELADYKVKGLALVALVDNAETVAVKAYWNMSVTQRAYAATHIKNDVFDGIVLANLDRYRGMMENEERGEEGGENRQ